MNDRKDRQKHFTNAAYILIKKHRPLLLTLSAAVVFVTTYLLILPAVTLDTQEAEQQGGIDVPAAQEQAEPYESADPAESEGTLSFDTDDCSISATYDAKAGLPQGTELAVSEIGADEEDYDALREDALQAVQAGEGGDAVTDLKFAYFYDISLISEGEVLEPEAPVDLTISYDKPLQVSDADHLRIVHFGEDGAQMLDPDEVFFDLKKGKLRGTAFAAESFSVYAVVYAQISRQYLSADGKTYDITVVFEEDAQIPAGSELAVREIAPDSTEYQGYLRKSVKQLGEDSIADISYARFFDIEIVDGSGNKIEPKTPVLVNIEYGEGAEIEAAKDVHVVHFADDGTEVLEGIGVNADGTVMTYLQNGFSVTGTVVSSPAANDQYMVLIEYDLDHDGTSEYYIVNNDGSLTKVSDTAGDTVDVDEPMMWTYDGQNIYHHSEQTSFNNSQVAADFYNKYIDPTDAEDAITTENSGNTPLRNVNEQYFDWNTWSMKTFTYQVTNGRPMKEVTSLVLSGDKIRSAASDQYLGVVEEDGVLRLVGGVNAENAVTVRLAQANQVLKTNYLNHTVNHIDISIEGEAEADIPLAYGKYYDANGNVLLDVQQNKTLHLTSGVVGINMDDMKRAIITAYTKDANGTTKEIDNAFVINGFSANESTDYSTQQVRIEGDFKVADIAPVTQSYYNSNRNQVWQDRLNHKIYYSVTAFKTVEFDLIDPDVGQLYDSEGNKMTVKVDVALSASFDFWDKRNECPPVQWDSDWLAGRGTIPDHNLSGMDFVLGGNPEGNAKVRAVEIKKIIVDENGNRISPKTPIQQAFNIYYNPDSVDANTNGEGTADNLRNSAAIRDKDSQSYKDYDPAASDSGFYFQHQKTLRVGEDGVGQLYDYDVNEGVFYISEDKDDVQETILDTSNKTWYYGSTYIETEYVWRNKADYDNTVHTSETYSDLENENYASRAEVLGRYRNYSNASENLDNQFLEFTVYNVYRSSLIETRDIDVTKTWTDNEEDPDVTEVYLKLYRKTEGSDPEEVTATMKSEVQSNAQNLYQYFAKAGDFDADKGWIVVKKGTSGWDTVSVKNLPVKTSAEENAPEYTYYFREVGYKDAEGKVYNSADAYSPEYSYQTGTETSDVPADGVALADDMHFAVTNTKSSTTTNYTVTKSFEGGDYPTDGSAQVLVRLEKAVANESGQPLDWSDAGTDVISLPRPYSEKPENSNMTEAQWYASADAWTYTWEGIPAVQKVNGEEKALRYRVKEISADWFGVPSITDYGRAVVPLTEDLDNSEAVAQQKSAITNQPTTDTLTVNKAWAVDGTDGNWPEGAEATVQVVQYWHLAEIDSSSDPAAVTAGDTFHSEVMPGEAYTETLDKDTQTYTFNNLPSYGYIVNPTDEQIVEAKENGVSLESGRTYLVIYTYGAKETGMELNGQSIPVDLSVPGKRGKGEEHNSFTANITNELTNLTVKKEWRRSGAETADTNWPEGVEIKYSIMRVPVYTMEDGRTVEFDAEMYMADSQTTVLTSENFQAGVEYKNLPLQGVKMVSGNEHGMVNGNYPVRYRYYVVEKEAGSPLANGLSTTEITAEPEDGVATLVNEYTQITVEKKWQKKNSSGQDEEVSFPEGFKVNWKIVQKASDGSVVDPYYAAYTEPASGETPAWDNRLNKGNSSHTLTHLPAVGVNAKGEAVTYTYEVYELPEGSESPESNPYPFQMIKAKEGTGEHAGTFTITNDLTSVTVVKDGDKGSSVAVQLYATTEKPSDLATVDVKVTLDEWGTDSLGADNGPLSSGEVIGTLTGSDGSSRTFALNTGNGWSQTFAGLPKNDSNGDLITYSVSVTSGPADGNTATYKETTTDNGMTVFHLQANGQANKVQFKFRKSGDYWPSDNPGWYVKVIVKDKDGTLVDSGEFMWNNEWDSKVLEKGEYSFEYQFIDNEGGSHAGYSFDVNNATSSINQTGEVVIDVGLNYTAPKATLTFNTGTGWPQAGPATTDNWSVEVMAYDSNNNNVGKVNIRWFEDERQKSIKNLEPGTYRITYRMSGGSATSKGDYSILGVTEFNVTVEAGDTNNYYIDVNNNNPELFTDVRS